MKAMIRIWPWQIGHGKVRTELDEERAEVLIDAVKIVVIDHRRAVHHPRVAHPGLRISPRFGAHHPRLLLRTTHVRHAFLGIEVPQILLRDIVLALVLGATDQVNPALGDESFDLGHKRFGLRRHTCRRRKSLPKMPTQVPHHSAHPLQLRHVQIQVHPVDAFILQHDMFPQNFTHAVWQCHFRLRSSIAVFGPH